MKLFYTILLLLTFSIHCLANVWQGDYSIDSQKQANEFYERCQCDT